MRIHSPFKKGTITVVALTMLAIAIANRTFLQSANSALIAPIVVTARGSFDIPAETSSGMVDFVARNGSLHFLLVNTISAQVVKTNVAGQIERHFDLPLSPTASNSRVLRVSDTGSIAILQPVRSGAHLILLDNTGNLKADVRLNHWISDLEFVGQQLVGLDEANSTLWRVPDESVYIAMTPVVSWPSALIRQPGDALGILEKGLGRFRMANANFTLLPPIELQAPEIQGVLRPIGTSTSVNLVTETVASDESGRMYCSISPYYPEKGAIILRFDEMGKLQARLRCQLPTVTALKGKGNPGGHIMTSRLGVSNDTLFIASTLGLKCAVYSIPQR